jgi:hypothetical protein
MNMRMSSEDFWEANERAMVRDAIRDTENEIARDAFDLPDPDDNPDDLELFDVEGWDGEPLSDLEIAHRNIYGDDPNNFDRQVALAADRELMGENERLQQELEQTREAFDREFNAPERRAALEANLRDQLYRQYGVLPTDDAGVTRLLSDLTAQQNQIHALNEDRINSSMSTAHDRYGAEFEAGFAALSRASKGGDRTAQMFVSDIMNSADPGERLMEISRYTSEPRGGGRGGPYMPSLNSGTNYGARASPARGRSDRDLADDYSGWGSEDAERDIFESVFR